MSFANAHDALVDRLEAAGPTAAEMVAAMHVTFEPLGSALRAFAGI